MKLDSRRLAVYVGVVLVLGGTAHSAGVIHRYVTHGLPDLNRMLLFSALEE
jgi:hypothetical protein